MASIREFTLDVATHAIGHPKVVMMGKEKMGQISEMQGASPTKYQLWAGCLLSRIFFCLSMFPNESFSIRRVYHCFSGAPEKMLALKGEKQVASLCEQLFSGEIMFFPKVRVHCCWDTAKSSLSTPSGGDNNAHVCHFLISVEITGFIFMSEKKIYLENQHPPPTKTPPSRLLHFYVKCPRTSWSLLPSLCPPQMTQPHIVPLVPVGGDRDQHSGGSGMSHSPQGHGGHPPTWDCCPSPALSISLGIFRELFLVQQQSFNLKNPINYENTSRQGHISLTNHADRCIG